MQLSHVVTLKSDVRISLGYYLNKLMWISKKELYYYYSYINF